MHLIVLVEFVEAPIVIWGFIPWGQEGDRLLEHYIVKFCQLHPLLLGSPSHDKHQTGTESAPHILVKSISNYLALEIALRRVTVVLAKYLSIAKLLLIISLFYM